MSLKHSEQPKRNRDILKRYRKGESPESIAESYHLTVKYVRQLLQSHVVVPRKYKDFAGKRQGILTFRKHTGEIKDGYSLWLCDCDCGGTVIMPTCSRRRSCGCVRPGANKWMFRKGSRNAKIVELYASGKYSLEALAYRYGITHQRVQDILADFAQFCEILRNGGEQHGRRGKEDKEKSIHKNLKRLQRVHPVRSNLHR